MFKKRNSVLFIFFAVVLVLGVIGLRVQKRQVVVHQQPPLRVGYNVESVNHAPIMVAYEKGFFTQHTIAIELVPFPSGKEVAQALASGQVDIGSAGITTFLIPIAKGVPIRVISPSTSSPTEVYIRPGSGIEKLADLKGKKVGVDSGSSDALVLLTALKAEGIANNDVTMVDIAKSVRPQALMQKKAIDAAVAGDFEMEIYQKAGAVVLPEWETKGYTSKTFPRTVIAAYMPVLTSRHSEVTGFILSLVDSEKFIHEQPLESAAIVAKHINDRASGAVAFTPEGIQKSWKTLKYDLWYQDEVVQSIADVAYDVGMTGRSFKLEEFFDQSFKNILQPAQYAIYGQ